MRIDRREQRVHRIEQVVVEVSDLMHLTELDVDVRVRTVGKDRERLGKRIERRHRYRLFFGAVALHYLSAGGAVRRHNVEASRIGDKVNCSEYHRAGKEVSGQKCLLEIPILLRSSGSGDLPFITLRGVKNGGNLADIRIGLLESLYLFFLFLSRGIGRRYLLNLSKNTFDLLFCLFVSRLKRFDRNVFQAINLFLSFSIFLLSLRSDGCSLILKRLSLFFQRVVLDGKFGNLCLVLCLSCVYPISIDLFLLVVNCAPIGIKGTNLI